MIARLQRHSVEIGRGTYEIALPCTRISHFAAITHTLKSIHESLAAVNSDTDERAEAKLKQKRKGERERMEEPKCVRANLPK